MEDIGAVVEGVVLLLVQGEAEAVEGYVAAQRIVEGIDDRIEVEARRYEPAGIRDREDLPVRALEILGLLLQLDVLESVYLRLLAALLHLVLDGDVLDLAARVLVQGLVLEAGEALVVVQRLAELAHHLVGLGEPLVGGVYESLGADALGAREGHAVALERELQVAGQDVYGAQVEQDGGALALVLELSRRCRAP